jgi:hypothetical protein
VLLGLLVEAAFVPEGPLVVGIDERRHLGFETQRQWSDLAIRRTTPALLGLFSVVTLLAHRRMGQPAAAFRQVAWYHKSYPTCCRRFGVGAKGAVGARGDFSRVACGCRGGKSPAGVNGTLDRRTLLCGLMAKVEPKADSRKLARSRKH